MTATVDLRVPQLFLPASPQSVGTEFPYFRLGDTATPLVSTSLRGKPTLITFVNTWLPQAAAQFSILSELASQKEINVVAIVPQETASSVATYKKRAGLSFALVADPDGDLIDAFHIHAFPTHVVVDRKGIIQSMQTGLYDTQQLLDILIK